MAKYKNLMAEFVANLAVMTPSQLALQRETICEVIEEEQSDTNIEFMSRQLAVVDTVSDYIHGPRYQDAIRSLHKQRIQGSHED